MNLTQFDNWTDTFTSPICCDNLSTHFNDYLFRHDHLPVSPQLENTSFIALLCLALLLSIIIISTIVGNVLVLVAILRERNLQTESNHLVFSLAVADLLVACLIMPIGAQYEVMNHQWVLGPILCEMWTSADVLCCTASILHLVAIAVDRYCAVTNVNYIQHRSCRRVCLMITLVWSIGFLVSFGPILGWKDENFLQRIQEEKRCLVSQDMGYQIFATCSSFYVPLIIILFLYWRIYQVVRKRIRHRPGHNIRPTTLLPLVCEVTVMDMTSLNGSAKAGSSTKAKKNLDSKREKKAATTLVVITGVFIVCWLPFFVITLLMALCPLWAPDPRLFSLFLWLGYMNSTLNPLIYTLFCPDFRKAFAKVFLRRKHSAGPRINKLRCLYSIDSVF